MQNQNHSAGEGEMGRSLGSEPRQPYQTAKFKLCERACL